MTRSRRPRRSLKGDGPGATSPKANRGEIDDDPAERSCRGLLLGPGPGHRPWLSVGGNCARGAYATYSGGADLDERTGARRVDRYDSGSGERHRTAGDTFP